MPKHATTIAELRSMSAADLRKDIAELRTELAKKRLAVEARTEKDTASYTRSKKQLARALTVLAQIEQSVPLNNKPKTSKVSAPVTSA